MRRAALLLPVALALALAACGSSRTLRPAEGRGLPPVPYGGRTTPTPDDLLEPTVQARPQRSGEALRRSEERRSDDFDLPPN